MATRPPFLAGSYQIGPPPQYMPGRPGMIVSIDLTLHYAIIIIIITLVCSQCTIQVTHGPCQCLLLLVPD